MAKPATAMKSIGVMCNTELEQLQLEKQFAGQQSKPSAEVAAIARHLHEVKLTLEQERICAELDRAFLPAVREAMDAALKAEEVTDEDRIVFAEFRDSCRELGLPHLPAPPQAVAQFLAAKSDRSSDELEKALRSIAKVHIAAFGISPCDDRLVKAVLATVRNEEANEAAQEGRNTQGE